MKKRVLLLISFAISFTIGMADRAWTSWLPHLSAGKKIGAALATAAILPFAHGLLQRPYTPSIELENLHVATLEPATQLHALLPTISMREIFNALSTNAPLQALHTSSDRSFAITSGIPHDSSQTIFIYSHGWKGGPCDTWARYIGNYRGHGTGILVAQKYLTKGIVNGPMVTFDYPTDATSAFNVGQELDVECLYTVYVHVAAHNPRAKIVLVGDCKGATAVLHLITHPVFGKKLHHVKGIVLESPPLSLESAIYQMSGYIDQKINLRSRYVIFPMFNALAKAWLPTYRAQGDCKRLLARSLEYIHADLPLYIGSISTDEVAAHSMTQKCIAQLQQSGNPHVHLFTTDESLRHAHIIKSDAYINGANAFLRRYGLVHDEQKALQGEDVLIRARIDAEKTISSSSH